MSDFSENENKTVPEHEPQRLTVPEHDEMDDAFASVFGDPAELKRKKATNGKTKRIGIAVVSCLLVAALVGGIFAVKKFIKPMKSNQPNIAQPTEIMERSADDFTDVTFVNENGTFHFTGKMETVEETDDYTGETTSTEAVVWTKSGEYAEQTDADKVSSIIESIPSITAAGTVEPDEMYGLDTPRCTVTVKDSKNGDFTLKIGVESFGVCYVEYSTDGKIYKAEADDVESLVFKMEDIYKAEDIVGLSSSDLKPYLNEAGDGFVNVKLTVSGKNFEQPLVIEEVRNGEDDVYRITSPENYLANSEKMETLSDIMLNALSVDGVYALKATPEKLAECGLDDPDVVLTMTIGNLTHTLKLAQLGDYDAVVLADNSDMIYQCSSVSDYLDDTIEDFREK